MRCPEASKKLQTRGLKEVGDEPKVLEETGGNSEGLEEALSPKGLEDAGEDRAVALIPVSVKAQPEHSMKKDYLKTMTRVHITTHFEKSGRPVLGGWRRGVSGERP